MFESFLENGISDSISSILIPNRRLPHAHTTLVPSQLLSQLQMKLSLEPLANAGTVIAIPLGGPCCGKRRVTPKDTHILNSQMLKCLPLHVKRKFADVIMLNNLKGRDCTGLSWWAQYNQKDCY